jgi:TolB-like protein/Flp pilus assembly protein TadD
MGLGAPEHQLPLTPEEIRHGLSQVLASKAFARSEPHRCFLRHAVEAVLNQRTEVLKESILGVEVFNRGSDFDPNLDNVVRVEARRLRQRLSKYYQNEGRGDEVLIELPVGSYVPQFSRRSARMPARVVPGRSMGRLAAFIAVALVAIAVVLHLALRRREPPLLAVLPFAEFSPAGGDAVRGDAIADDILQLLAETPGLRVVSRTSAFRFRPQNAQLDNVRRQLGAEMLVEGSVRQVGNRTHISVRLLDGKTGIPVWAGTQDCDASGLEAAERAIAQRVAAVLGASLRAPGHTPPPEARDLFAKARFAAARGDADGRARALDLFRRVVALDPDFARAWGELARQLSLNAFHEPGAADRLVIEVRNSAAHALRLDPALADPYFALARVAWFYDWDWPVAEKNWQRVLEINPNYAGAHQAYALALVTRRRFGEALTHSRRAVELNPLAYAASKDLGVVLYAARRFDEAASHARASLSLAPDPAGPLFLLGSVDAARGRYADAIRELEKSAALQSRAPAILGRLGHAYARSGRLAEAQSVLAELERNPQAPRIYAAMVETGLGHSDRAIQLIEASVAKREPDVLFLGVDAVFDPLRRDGRFRVLCSKIAGPAR